MKTFRNGGKMTLTINLPGRSVHLRPKDTVDLGDRDQLCSEALKHIKKGRLVEVVSKKASPVVSKPPVKTKSAMPPLLAGKEADAEKNGDK